jgi:purine-cytosine permease-like protein
MKAIIYLIGTLVVLAGVIYGASQMGVPQTWLIVIGLVIGGLGIMGAARSAAGTTKAVETTTTPGRGAQTRETTVSSD